MTAICLEAGSKKVFAAALDWPGWCRSGKTEDAAVEALGAYAERYAAIAADAGARFPKSAADSFDVVERLKGSASTDFGVPGEVAQADWQPLTKAKAERFAAILEASWDAFDRVVASAPASLRKGPRGGGRDRDKILEHVVGAEVGYARKIDLRYKEHPPSDSAAVAEVRAAVADAIRSARKPAPDREKAWPYRYAVRRFTWHVLDHLWEIEDRSE